MNTPSLKPIPDRLSADKDSYYYKPDLIDKVKVYLSGELVQMVTEYCISEGWITTASAKVDLSGFEYVTHHGIVIVERTDN